MRISPKLLLINSASAVPEIYHRSATKTDHYISGAFGATESVFNTKSHVEHAQKRKLIAGPYSFSKISKTEPLIDEQILAFINRLDVLFAQTAKPFDFAPWAVYMAFDVISTVGFGKPLGFVESGDDVGGLIQGFHEGLRPFGLLSRMYPFTAWIKTTPLARYLVATPDTPSGIGVLMRWRDKLLADRLRELEEGDYGSKDRADLMQG